MCLTSPNFTVVSMECKLENDTETTFEVEGSGRGLAFRVRGCLRFNAVEKESTRGVIQGCRKEIFLQTLR